MAFLEAFRSVSRVVKREGYAVTVISYKYEGIEIIDIARWMLDSHF